MVRNFQKYDPPLPGDAEDNADCPAMASTVDRDWPWMCTRDEGHEGRHEAAGFSGILASWEDGDE